MATLTGPELQLLSSRHIAVRVAAVGDSYVNGAGGASFAIGLRNQGKVVINLGAGGATMTDIVAQITSNLSIIRQCSHLVVWDGSANGLVTTESYLDELQTGLSAAGLPFVVIPVSVPYNTSAAGYPDFLAAMVARWGGRVHDWTTTIANTAGVINQNRMLDYPTDTIHLNQTAYDEAGAGVAAMLS